NELASNPKVALRLAGMLRKAAEDLDQTDKTLTEAQRKQERKPLQDKRNYIEFLSPCLGSLIIPTGVPLLTDLARKGKGTDVKTVALLRRQAVYALTLLGENLKRFEQLSPDQRDAVLEGLQAAALGKGEQAEWARLTLGYLEGQQKNLGVVQALAECARADDPYLRTQVALALTFWEGEDEDEKALAGNTLIRLSHDDGHGVRIEIGETD